MQDLDMLGQVACAYAYCNDPARCEELLLRQIRDYGSIATMEVVYALCSAHAERAHPNECGRVYTTYWNHAPRNTTHTSMDFSLLRLRAHYHEIQRHGNTNTKNCKRILQDLLQDTGLDVTTEYCNLTYAVEVLSRRPIGVGELTRRVYAHGCTPDHETYAINLQVIARMKASIHTKLQLASQQVQEMHQISLSPTLHTYTKLFTIVASHTFPRNAFIPDGVYDWLRTRELELQATELGHSTQSLKVYWTALAKVRRMDQVWRHWHEWSLLDSNPSNVRLSGWNVLLEVATRAKKLDPSVVDMWLSEHTNYSGAHGVWFKLAACCIYANQHHLVSKVLAHAHDAGVRPDSPDVAILHRAFRTTSLDSALVTTWQG